MDALLEEPRIGSQELQITKDVAAELKTPHWLVEILSVLGGIPRIALGNARGFDPRSKAELREAVEVYRLAQRLPETKRSQYRVEFQQLASRIRELAKSA